MNYFLAFDMGGTNLKTALVSEDNINARDWNFEIFSTPSKASVTDNCAAVAAALEKTLSELPPGFPRLELSTMPEMEWSGCQIILPHCGILNG